MHFKQSHIGKIEFKPHWYNRSKTNLLEFCIIDLTVNKLHRPYIASEI